MHICYIKLCLEEKKENVLQRKRLERRDKTILQRSRYNNVFYIETSWQQLIKVKNIDTKQSNQKEQLKRSILSSLQNADI